MIILEPFNLSYLDEVLQLFHDTVQTINIRDYSQNQVNAWTLSTSDKERWANKLTKSICYVAKSDNTIVGFADATQEGTIEHVYTHKDYQGRGIASALLNKLEHDMRNLGFKEVQTVASITAKPFFERRGYRVDSMQDMKHRTGVVFRNFLMSKKL